MLSIEEARRALGADAEGLSDEEIARLAREAHDYAEALVDAILGGGIDLSTPVPQPPPGSKRAVDVPPKKPTEES